MKTRVLCLGLVLVLLFSGCTNKSTATIGSEITNHSTTTSAAEVVISTSNTEAENTITTTTVTAAETLPQITASDKTNVGTTTVTADALSTVTQKTDNSTTSTTTENTVTFKATIRDNIQKKAVSGVTVTVFVDGSYSAAGSAITDENGVVHISLRKGNSYRVALSTLPIGYEADSEYRFATNTVNITIRKAAVQNETDHSQAQYDIGKTMTDFSLTDTDDKTYRLSDLLKTKKLVILNFWFTSCEPCKMEFPFFETVSKQYSDDITLLAIDPFDSVQAMVAIRNQLNVTFPMLQDTCKLYQGFDVTAYPTTVFIAPDGQILDIHVGSFPSEAAFLSAIKTYLH